MKKRFLIIAIIITALIIPIQGVNALNIIQNNDIKDSSTSNMESSHTVFCELAVTSDSENSPETAELLQNIYESGEYDFKYITYVADQHPDASDWINDRYNIAGYPTCVFDGGFEVLYKSPAAQSVYENKIYISSYRNVHDLDVEVVTHWFEDCCNQELNMEINVENNEDAAYNGILKVYIVEKNSRWTYQIGEEVKPYQFAFIDIAMDENIFVPAGETVTFVSPEWIPFVLGGVNASDLFVIAVLSNKNPYPGYSDPPYNENKFSSNAVDEVAVQKIRKKVSVSKIGFMEKPLEKRFQFMQVFLQKLLQNFLLINKNFF